MKSRSSVIDQHFQFCHYSCHKFWRSGFIFKLIIYGRIVKISFRDAQNVKSIEGVNVG